MKNNPHTATYLDGITHVTLTADDEGQTATGSPSVTQDEGQNVKTFSEEEVKKLLQQEGDRRVSEAQKKFEKKLEEVQKQLELTKLTEEERMKKQEEERKKELEEKEKEIARRELDFETVSLLAEKKLTKDFLKVLAPLETLDGRKEALDLMLDLIAKEAERRVKETEKGTFIGASGKEDPKAVIKPFLKKKVSSPFATNETK